jgi:hypothetical protein
LYDCVVGSPTSLSRFSLTTLSATHVVAIVPKTCSTFVRSCEKDYSNKTSPSLSLTYPDRRYIFSYQPAQIHGKQLVQNCLNFQRSGRGWRMHFFNARCTGACV